ncbi:MAG TPA: AmmeMemoRadiSam system protein B [Bacteroidales bacterium]|nr:AmmeMemoRadiSam system protein B [Bacteroidales bacterium]HPS17208.1 AmmeMemoRadiSam system protein B [Bacteroidales bacterium]
MKKLFIFSLIILCCFHLNAQNKTRKPVDSVGFATKAWQMDSIVKRLHKQYDLYYDSVYQKNNLTNDIAFRFAISPHDDYTYAGFLYDVTFSHIKAKTVIIFGVAHKAKKFGIERKLVFDSFDEWQEPYGNIAVSPLRQQLMNALPRNDYIVHDSLQIVEHSVEAFVPFLQYYNKNVEIISILVPYMPFADMQKYSDDMAKALNEVMKKNNLQWGKDIALIASTDAVHYGDEDWGGKNYALYGCDEKGFTDAVNFEHQIMNECLAIPDSNSAKKFFEYTVQNNDWREYKWTWCGRYSVPFGMLTANKLQKLSGTQPLKLMISDYSTSIAHKPFKLDDIKMGATAIANLHHWVGYAVVGYK